MPLVKRILALMDAAVPIGGSCAMNQMPTHLLLVFAMRTRRILKTSCPTATLQRFPDMPVRNPGKMRPTTQLSARVDPLTNDSKASVHSLHALTEKAAVTVNVASQNTAYA